MGLFVTLEGPEGSGKSTQAELLAKALRARGARALLTREPGGTPIGERIRAVLHDPASRGMQHETECLLYNAARAQHVAQRIRPALAEGQVVICDRYAESTLAYQGYGHGLSLDVLEATVRLATGGLRADLVVYLDLAVEEGLARKRRDRDQGRGEWNRMDELAVSFHQRVRQGYLAMAAAEPDRWLVIDGAQTVAAVHAQILRRIEPLLAEAR